MMRLNDRTPGGSTAFMAAGAGALALLLLFTIFNQSNLAGPAGRHWWTDLWWTFTSLAAGLLCLDLSRQKEFPHRTAWLLVGLGCLSWSAGMLIWDLYELALGWITPFPSLADAGFSAFNLLVLAGGLALNSGRAGLLERGKLFVDSLILMNALALALAMLFYDALIHSDISIAGKITALLYPVTAFAACYVLAVARAGLPAGTDRQAWNWLLAGMALTGAAETGYLVPIITGGYAVGSMLDPLWTASFLCIILGALKIRWSRHASILEALHET